MLLLWMVYQNLQLPTNQATQLEAEAWPLEAKAEAWTFEAEAWTLEAEAAISGLEAEARPRGLTSLYIIYYIRILYIIIILYSTNRLVFYNNSIAKKSQNKDHCFCYYVMHMLLCYYYGWFIKIYNCQLTRPHNSRPRPGPSRLRLRPGPSKPRPGPSKLRPRFLALRPRPDLEA